MASEAEVPLDCQNVAEELDRSRGLTFDLGLPAQIEKEHQSSEAGDVEVGPPIFCTGFGKNDTHAVTLSDGRPNQHPDAGKPYSGITGAGIVAMVQNPPSVPKEMAQWFIPSNYLGCDARTHEVQRERGQFLFLGLDVDQNNLSLAEVQEALEAVLGDCGKLIYATRSATPEIRKWRALVPLQHPLAGVCYSDTATAFYDALEEASGGVLICDRSLALTGQPVYLPNRGAFYENAIIKGARADLTADHPIITRRDDTRAKRAKAEAVAKAEQARRAAERAKRAKDGDVSPVDTFNARHAVADLLERYVYARAGHSKDWRSRYQTGGSYATRDFGEYWISLSASDAAAAIGATTRDGHQHGDAFDLFVHYEHGGDFKKAVAAYGAEIRPERMARSGQADHGRDDSPGGQGKGSTFKHADGRIVGKDRLS